MKFLPTPLAGAYVVDLDPKIDERGLFARAFCEREFSEQGLETRFVQANINSNRQAGTIRGMHYQRGVSAEVKLVRCIAGAVYDVVIDVRPESATYLRWFGAELTAENGRMMYVPRGFAHGCQSLTPGATLYYLVSAFYDWTAESGLRYDDPAVGIVWPLPVGDISQKDATWPWVGQERGGSQT